MRRDPRRTTARKRASGRDCHQSGAGKRRARRSVYTETINPLPASKPLDFKALVADHECGQGRSGWWFSMPTRCTPRPRTSISQPPSTMSERWRISARIYDETAQSCAVAHPRRALPGDVVGCACVRRHGVHRAADDRAAVRRPDAAHDVSRRCWTMPDASALRGGPRTLEAADQGRLRSGMAQGTPCWLDRWHGFRRRKTVAAKAASLPRAPRRSSSRTASKSSSGPIRISTTAVSRTSAGCRSCRSR